MLSSLDNSKCNKMLYIFHVDIGSMMTFEMESALHTVAQLKERIFLATTIPAEKQVLVVSGGVCLCSDLKVCSYSGGTDTNPIFLFSKLDIEDTLLLPEESIISRSDTDLLTKVQQSITEQTVTSKIVQQRASLAQQLYDIAVEYHSHCKKLVHDQHLQQQGWMAVVANLEDITAEFKQRADLFQEAFTVYFNSYDDYKHLVEGYHEDLKLLANTPLLPALLLHERNAPKENDELSPLGQLFADPTASVSLLDFMTSWENDKPFQQLFDYCTKGLEQFDSKVSERMQTEINEVLDLASNADMKEVKGIGDRLFGLEKLIIEALDLVKEQQDQSNAFNANNSKVLKTGDKSILPDLCNSHTLQLQSMAQTHQNLCDIRRRCIKAKEELIKNLFFRLKWIMYVENKILEASQKLFVCHENLRRLCRQLDILQQIHKAPYVYLSSLAEVVRRRKFSEGFLWWASDIACRLLTIYNEESMRRKEFRAATEGHFLNVLFPGMEDMPPAFAIEAPSMFDTSLPPISCDDIKKLMENLPETLRNELKVADISATLDFFTVKEIKSEEELHRPIEAEDSENIAEQATIGNEDYAKPRDSEPCLGAAALSLLRDLDKGCESETDTEEFEKLCQSPLELQFERDVATERKTQDIGTLTEVGERSPIPPKKPPRATQKQTHPPIIQQVVSFEFPTPTTSTNNFQRALSCSGSNTTDSFTNLKNPSLESIDELSSLKNFQSSNADYNSHYYYCLQSYNSTTNNLLRSKSLSPHTTPLSPKDAHHTDQLSLSSPIQAHQQQQHLAGEFVTDEFYIDESLPSSLSLEAGGEYAKQLATANNVVALLQDNLQSSKIDCDRLKDSLTEFSSYTHNTINILRIKMQELKDFYASETKSIEKHYEGLTESWEQVSNDNEIKAQQMSRLTTDHEDLLRHFKSELDLKTEQLRSLHDENTLLEQKLKDNFMENSHLKSEIDRINQDKLMECSRLLQAIDEKEVEKEKAVQVIKEEIIRKHNIELENMRSRFKLLEKIPNDSAIEKQHQLLAELEVQKADAIERAVLSERSKWETIANISADKSNEQKDVVIANLQKEIEQLKKMQREATIDLIEINTDTKKVDELGASVVVGVTDSKTDAATSPIKCKDKLTGSQMLLIKSNKLSISSCNPGDLVLVIWEPKLQNYKILQENNTVYFLHSDCLATLGLKKGDDSKTYCIGQVVHKDYCQTRKSQNRYNVPIGTRFYRVTVKPVSVSSDSNKESERRGTTSSQCTTESQPQCSTSGDLPDSGPSSTPMSFTRSSNVMDESAMARSTPESMQNLMDTSSSSNRTHTFTYILSDPWRVGSTWILENS